MGTVIDLKEYRKTKEQQTEQSYDFSSTIERNIVLKEKAQEQRDKDNLSIKRRMKLRKP